ncbi:hypothetical protein [Pararhodospirillum oryzae]|uniref:Uncharacterized protein n=1 Tax=Pararhodospirillum oryzae TaxID=478448 RepID=A0A512H6B7_9PROT|nr:hypothetical protein [Pararhodospirillum oryzae]GEO80968.1 hypothetical protein ROR02_10990 [Pararhodospirillum oryzae]
MTDTRPVEVTLIQVDRTPGRGSLVALAVAEIDVGGIVFRLQAVPIRCERGGRLTIGEPCTRDPSGAWVPAVCLPPEVFGALTDLVRAELREAA